MYAAGFHLTLLSIERATATIKSRVYEKSRGFVWVLLLIVLTWALSFVVIYCVQYSLVSPYIALGIIVVVDGVALAVMLVLFYVNHKMYHRVASEAKHSTHSLSQRYQFSENIFSSRLLKRLLLFLAGASVIAIISYFGFVFCGDQTTLGRVSGFVFDLTIASLTSLVPIIIIAGTPRLRHSTFDRMCPQAVRSLTVGPAIPTDINGNRLIIQDETNVYFDQLKSSWN